MSALPYQAPPQSPSWDNVTPLATLLATARFFILLKGRPHGDLVDVVTATEWINDKLYCTVTALSHDGEGVTYKADGSASVQGIVEDMTNKRVLLTADSDRVLRYIWEYMTEHPNSEKKLFD